jgi:hypothetical protein
MWSNPDANWAGFQPIPYVLNSERTSGLPFMKASPTADVLGRLTDIRVRPSDQLKWFQTNLDEILRGIRNRQNHTIENAFVLHQAYTHPLIAGATTVQLAITTGSDGIVVSSVHFNCDLLRAMLDLQSIGADPFDTEWFWYDTDHLLDSPLDSYSFFVTHGEAIVRERVRFSDAHDYGFDPDVFDGADRSEMWTGDKGWRDAHVRFWYRKFYRETRIGELMVLRSDGPPLFHYPEGELARRMYANTHTRSS